MKNFFKFALVMAMLFLPVVSNADEDSNMIQNKALSNQYKSQITILGHEIKALKAKIKANPSDINLNVELERKKVELSDIKEKKKIVDTAIKTEKASQKAAKAAEKARVKAEKAAEKANKLHSPAPVAQ
ncbi:MAG: hypothetical protein J6W52_01910 [Bacteroidaceae bacterium]|nr:hypothetical protein [Bacteroidaceae bacterium]